MALKITSLKDVFKQNVINSVKVPTIWVDIDGVIHEDYEATIISAEALSLKGMATFKRCAYIKQVGSAVTTLGNAINSINFTAAYKNGVLPIDQDRTILDKSFLAYAVNLKKMFSTFRTIAGFNFNIDNLIDGLFDNCHNLTMAESVFINCNVTSIPEDLFVNCPNLSIIDRLFCNTDIETIPEDLFSKNRKIVSAYETFAFCDKLTRRPSNIFKNCITKPIQTDLFAHSGPTTI